MKKTPTSPWRPQVTILAAQASSRAARRYENELAPRLGDDFLDQLDRDVQTLEQLHTARSGPRETMKARTRELRAVLVETHSFLTGLRAAIALKYPPRHPMRGHFGLGIRIDVRSMKAMLDALRMFIKAMEEFPAEAAAATLGANDLAKLKGFLVEIDLANSSQEDGKYQRKKATALLEAANHAVYSKLNLLRSAVMIDLAHNPQAQSEIVGALPRRSRSRNRDRSTEE